MAVTVQNGIKSLFSVGLGVADVASLIQHGRSFGNFLFTQNNDVELFESLSEVYGVILKRRGLIDPTLMENQWSQNINLIVDGRILENESMPKTLKDEGYGSFTWLMIVLITGVDVCLLSHQVLELLIEVFVVALQRDDAEHVRESLEALLNTNIRSWRSSGCFLGMVAPLTAAIKDSRMEIVGHRNVPLLTRSERVELRDFVLWMLQGQSTRYRLVSATLYSLAEAFSRLGILIRVGFPKAELEALPTVSYAGSGDTDFSDALHSDLVRSGSSTKSSWVPARRIAYLAGKPSEMIESFPRPVILKNAMAKWWHRGMEAGDKVKITSSAPFRMTNKIHYSVSSFDECTSRWRGDLTTWSDEHFPVDSETLLRTLCDFNEGLSSQMQKWIRDSARPGSEIDDLSNTYTDEQLDLFLCYQSLVFGYWYKLLEPLVTMEYVRNEVYFYSVWGFRDTYLLVLLRTLATKFRTRHDLAPGPDRESIVQVLAVMFCGRSSFNPIRPHKNSSSGLVAVIDNIAIISKTLLDVPEDMGLIGCFCAVPLLVVGLLPTEEGELWTGETSELESSDCSSVVERLQRSPPLRQWTLHPKIRSVKGHLPRIVLAVRCEGILIGNVSPNDADCALIRARDNRCGAVGRRDEAPGDCASDVEMEFFNQDEEHFLSGIIQRPRLRGQVVLVQSYGSPAMRYAAAGFYYSESHTVMTNGTLDASITTLKEQFKQLALRREYGVIVD